MSPEKTKALFDEFTALYRGRFMGVKHSPMAFGFDVGDGWYQLIRNLSQDIDTIAKENNLIGDNYPKATQVKEKFGGLRFYIDGSIDLVYDAISKAEAASYYICEVCGKPGKARGDGWIVTICDLCDEERKKQ